MGVDSSRLTDADFLPPPERSLAELVDSLRAKLDRDVCDGEMIEDFRLFILARLHQGQTQSAVENEMIGWGLRAETAIELVCSTRSEGGDPVEYADVYLDGLHVGREIDPANKAKVRASDRAARRAREARRLVEAEGGVERVDLGYEPNGSTYMSVIASRKGEKSFAKIALVVVIAVVAIIAAYVLM